VKITTFAPVKKSFADILSGLEDNRGRKLSSKLPEWSLVEGLCIPSSLALEQCSSSATARYKASLIGNADMVVDITGGFGVDSWAFSMVADKVCYFEQNADLADAVRANYEALGVHNVIIRNECITEDSDLPDCDLLYADPARRSDTGRKVFLLEDCTPDVLTLMPLFWQNTSRIMFKLSPMADISMLSERFGAVLKEIHVVGLDGECKELLCILEKDGTADFSITVAELDSGASFKFSRREEKEATVSYTHEIRPGQFLFEPSAAFMKSGAFKIISERFGMEKMSRDTHLYVSDIMPEGLKGLGKFFEIKEVHPLDKASMKGIGKSYPKAEVTARGIPMRSEELRDRIGCKSGGSVHVFGCSAQVALPEGMVRVERMIVLCTPVAMHSVGIDH